MSIVANRDSSGSNYASNFCFNKPRKFFTYYGLVGRGSTSIAGPIGKVSRTEPSCVVGNKVLSHWSQIAKHAVIVGLLLPMINLNELPQFLFAGANILNLFSLLIGTD